MKKSIDPVVGGLLICVYCFAATASAQTETPATPAASGTKEAPNNVPSDGFAFKPVLLDTNTSTGSTLGLDYSYKWKKVFGGMHKAKGPDEQSGPPGVLTPQEVDKTVVSGGVIDLLARGTLANSDAKTSNKMLDFSVTGSFARDSENGYSSLGGLLTFETDQGGDNKQTMYGLSASYTKADVFAKGAYLTLQLGYGTVDPTADVQRKKLLGSLTTYQRGNLELSYNYPVHGTQIKGWEFNYRLYQESSAPPAIKAAGLNESQLWLVRANLPQDFFLEYSSGSLPFDQQSVRAVKIGWSIKVQ